MRSFSCKTAPTITCGKSTCSGTVEMIRPMPSSRSAAVSSPRSGHMCSTAMSGNSRSSWLVRKRLVAMPIGQTTTARRRRRVCSHFSSTAPKCMARKPASSSGMGGRRSVCAAWSHTRRTAAHKSAYWVRTGSSCGLSMRSPRAMRSSMERRCAHRSVRKVEKPVSSTPVSRSMPRMSRAASWLTRSSSGSSQFCSPEAASR